MLWINETSCCSIVERCHPDFWQFILFLSWLIILIILVSCSIQKYKDDLKEKKEKERQYKIEELDFGNETHIEPNKQEEKVPRWDRIYLTYLEKLINIFVWTVPSQYHERNLPLFQQFSFILPASWWNVFLEILKHWAFQNISQIN